MASPAKLISLAYGVETTFGTVASIFTRVTYASNIEFAPSYEMLPLDMLRDHPYADDHYIGPSRGAVLRFRLPLYSTSSASVGTALSLFLVNSMGGAENGPLPKSKTDVATAASYSPELATYVTAAPHFLAWTPTAGSPYQARMVTSKSGSRGLLLGKTVDLAGAAVVSDASGSCRFGLAAGQDTSSQRYSSSISFEIAGPENDDAYILTGCAGSARISGAANEFAFADFEFQVYSWTRTTRAALSHTGSADAIPVTEHAHSEPSKMTYSTASLHKFVTDQHDDSPLVFDVLGFEVDLGVRPRAVPSITYDNGTAGWFRESSNPTGSITTYFNEALYDRFEAQVAEQPLYIQIGAEENKTAFICVPNAVITQIPARGNSDGHLAMTFSFSAKHSITMPSGSPNQSTIWVGFA